VAIQPTPLQDPFDVWLGGIAPSELRRVGRLGDGWLPSFVTPEDAAAARPAVEEAASAAGRRIDPEHWGALVLYSKDGLPERFRAALAKRRPDVDPTSVVPDSVEGVRALLEGFIAHGFSKLVVVPAGDVADWPAEVSLLGDALLDLQN
jgi:alkanesulfonate monooxygenase SsuD/methylene tetrahydromethanopterin reductase-like flavin-dependent oxidoreductase (luciferase family)